jgi:hypothetical protein
MRFGIFLQSFVMRSQNYITTNSQLSIFNFFAHEYGANGGSSNGTQPGGRVPLDYQANNGIGSYHL